MSDKHFVSVGKGYSLSTSVLADIPRLFFYKSSLRLSAREFSETVFFVIKEFPGLYLFPILVNPLPVAQLALINECKL